MAQKILHGLCGDYSAFYKPALSPLDPVLVRVPAGTGKKDLPHERNSQRLHCDIAQF